MKRLRPTSCWFRVLDPDTVLASCFPHFPGPLSPSPPPSSTSSFPGDLWSGDWFFSLPSPLSIMLVEICEFLLCEPGIFVASAKQQRENENTMKRKSHTTMKINFIFGKDSCCTMDLSFDSFIESSYRLQAEEMKSASCGQIKEFFPENRFAPQHAVDKKGERDLPCVIGSPTLALSRECEINF